MDKKLNLIKSVALCVIAFCMAVAGYLFWEHRNYKEPVVVSEYITEVKKLSDYFDGVKGTTNDSNVYIFDSGVDGMTVQFTIAMVNSVEQRASYTWDYPRVRTFTPTASGVTFGAGGYLDSTKVGGIPVGANLHKDSSCCVPSVIYGFM